MSTDSCGRAHVPAGVSTGGQYATQPRSEPPVDLTWDELRALAEDPSVSDHEYRAMLLAKVEAGERALEGTWSIDDCTPGQRESVETYRRMAFDWAEPKVGLLGLDLIDDAEAFSVFAVKRIVAVDYDLAAAPGMQELFREFDVSRGVERAKELCRGPRQEQWVGALAHYPGLPVNGFGGGKLGMRVAANARAFVARLREGGVLVLEEPNGPRGGRHWRIAGTADPAA